MPDLCYPLRMARWRSVRSTGLAFLACFAVCGCRTTPDYARPLAPGKRALRIVVAPDIRAELADAFENKSDQLIQAMDRSVAWFDHASSRRYFPWEYPPITHLQARRSLAKLRELIAGAKNGHDFVHQLTAQFDIYESIGYDRKGTVFFTAYFAPEYPARRQPNAEFRYPLYEVPSDLRSKYVADGRWPTRLEIERDDLLAGHELVWLNDPLNVYLIHVNGSAGLRLGPQDAMYVGYTTTNEHQYTSLGKLLVAEGLLNAEEVSMQTIREAFDRAPATVGELMLRNARFVFFKEHGVDRWPLASLGVPLTAGASLATDKTVYPPGGLVLVRTAMVDETDGPTWTARFLLDQDSGGAIKGPGRADIFEGIGEEAGRVAGALKAHGRLFYFFLKQD